MERVGIVFGLLWIAAPELTLARPKAPQFAGRALIAPVGSQVGPGNTQSNAYYAAEVQSNSEVEALLSRLS